jgi:surfeit locus 1 family protein
MQRILMVQPFVAGRRKYMSVLVCVMLLVLVRLGMWQLERHTQRMDQNSKIMERMTIAPVELSDIEALASAQRDYRTVVVRGTYDTSQQILWRNREYRGRTGYHVMTPLRLADGRAILVNRGWIYYQEGLGDWQRAYQAPTGMQEIVGVWRVSQAEFDQINEVPLVDGRRDKWFYIDVAAIAAQTPYPLVDGFVELQPDGTAMTAGIPIPTETSDMGMGSHLSYAVQWFGFALILLVGYIVVQVRRPLGQAPPRPQH